MELPQATIELPLLPEQDLPVERVSSPSREVVDMDDIGVDLLDEYLDCDEFWDYGPMPSPPPSSRDLQMDGVVSSGIRLSGMRPGNVVFVWDVIPHPSLRDHEVIRVNLEQEKKSTAFEGDNPQQQSSSTETDHEVIEQIHPATSFSARELSNPLDNGMYEVWLVSEFADKGALEDHVVNCQLVRRSDGTPDTVRSIVSLDENKKINHSVRLLQDVILRLLLDIALGVEALHAHGITHGDLKMTNIMLVSDDSDPRGFVAKISDAGLVPLLDLTQTHTSTRHHSRLTCLPPEMIKHDEISPATDVYMFAMVMYKLFTCKRPFRDMNTAAFLHDVVDGNYRPEVPKECPPFLGELMQRCWASAPSER